jgi:voltage-dependent calcium channel T type alpha-1G
MLNVITMASIHEGQSQRFENGIKILNFWFSIFFIIEAVIKLLAYGCKVYFHEP